MAYDSTTETRPGVGSGIESVTICETSVRSPHDLLQLEEFAEESRELIVDLWRIRVYYTKRKSIFTRGDRMKQTYAEDAVQSQYTTTSSPSPRSYYTSPPVVRTPNPAT